MRMPGQSWPGAAASFLAMWMVMTVAMMLPSIVPILSRFRRAAVRIREKHIDRATAIVCVGYFFVWALVGVAVFPVGVALAAIEMQQPAISRVVPIAMSVAVLIAGALQFTAWKRRHLACCRDEPLSGRSALESDGAAWRLGVRVGRDCARCCANLMMV